MYSEKHMNLADVQTTAEQQFQAERRSGIGGSDIHHLWNLEPWGCRLRLWLEKRGVPAPKPVDETGPIRRGKLLEPLIANEYVRETGRGVSEEGIMRHRVYPELMVHVDRLIIADPYNDNKRGTGVLEIKCVGREIFAKYRREGLPPAYILQLQHAMLVNGAPWGAFAIFHADSWKMAHWDVAYDPTIGESIMDRGVAFWTMVENGPMPPPLPMTSKQCMRCPYRMRCHAVEMEAKLMQEEGGDPVPKMESPELALLAADYIEASEMVDDAEELKEAAKERLKNAMGGITAVEVPGAKIYYRPSKPGYTWNGSMISKRLVALGEQPETYQTPKKASRPLKVYER